MQDDDEELIREEILQAAQPQGGAQSAEAPPSVVAERVATYPDKDGQAGQRRLRAHGGDVCVPRPKDGCFGSCSTSRGTKDTNFIRQHRAPDAGRDAGQELHQGAQGEAIKGIENRLKNLELRNTVNNDKKEESAAATPCREAHGFRETSHWAVGLQSLRDKRRVNVIGVRKDIINRRDFRPSAPRTTTSRRALRRRGAE